MKKFTISWETDYCDNFPEQSGTVDIEAEDEKEAARKFYDMKIFKACISNIREVA